MGSFALSMAMLVCSNCSHNQLQEGDTMNQKIQECVDTTTLPRAKSSNRNIMKVVGPGLLYAASAVGVSHLAQATRAGAYYGFGMALIIILACLLKFPSIRFGGIYSAATGESLIAGYRKEGLPAFILYTATQILSGVFILAAVSMMTAGLIQASIGIEINQVAAIAILLVLTLIMLITGKYVFLEKMTKFVVGTFTVLIAIATVMMITKMDWSATSFAIPSFDAKTIPFILALIGFMPSPTEGCMLQSLWTVARAKTCGELPCKEDASLDFNVGYILSAVLALCFMILGAGIFYNSGVEVVTGNFGFSKQVIELFTKLMGSWSFPVIAIAATFVMFSTTYTVLDGYIRVYSEIITKAAPKASITSNPKMLYNIIGVVLSAGAIFVLAMLMKSFAMFMDMTSIIVFVTSPVFAILNHRSVFGNRMPEDHRPSNVMKIWSYIGIASLIVLTLIYIKVKFL